MVTSSGPEKKLRGPSFVCRFAAFSGFTATSSPSYLVFKLFDLNSNKYIKEKNINNFFANSENAEFFNDITKEEMYKLVNTKTKKLTYGVFIKSRGERNITTLQALQKAFPGKTSVLGKDVNERFNFYYFFRFHRKIIYTLQDAVEKIDHLLIDHYYEREIKSYNKDEENRKRRAIRRKRRQITPSSSSSFM
ncbi:uncharacterized protein LOC111059491 isoform X2 [Nilaparvata lugens]|uniref:uncharacterized protein LOC111059491 isoform X2 n=1 Tax=Nilaparvata lugens TaxID=108931 RepID=UPI00193D2D4F|nr:uncharacterized protein LOC111059491 isoform X2 [Nilaparvata lugens]